MRKVGTSHLVHAAPVRPARLRDVRLPKEARPRGSHVHTIRFQQHPVHCAWTGLEADQRLWLCSVLGGTVLSRCTSSLSSSGLSQTLPCEMKAKLYRTDTRRGSYPTVRTVRLCTDTVSRSEWSAHRHGGAERTQTQIIQRSAAGSLPRVLGAGCAAPARGADPAWRVAIACARRPEARVPQDVRLPRPGVLLLRSVMGRVAPPITAPRYPIA